MKRILVVASDKNELKGLPDSFDKAVVGVGPIMAAAGTMYAALQYEPEVIISIGSCGSLGRVKKGEVVSFSSVVCPDQNLTAMRLALGTTIDQRRSTVGALSTGDRTSPYVLSSSAAFTKEVTENLLALHADCTDMEAYGVGIAARMLEVPFYAVKLVTDIIGDSSSVGDISFSLREGRGRLVEKLISLQEVL
ncbi:MAG: hypothetical protein KBS81_11155 [Spirochaetales bacterium]|nr:hypothetical protein [Candidatus Physcosoma equi]